ncbi:MAG TPA: hypothetical protein VGD67_12130 [Pseudonocardiaceae bacterium]
MSTNTDPPPVITVRATIMDGQVVAWHRDVNAAASHRRVVSASRNGVSVHTEYLHQVPASWLAAAQEAYGTLRADRRADLSDWATHRNSVVPNGPLVPVDREADSG